MKRIDRIGQVYGRLTVVELSGVVRDSHGCVKAVKWDCLCLCGTATAVLGGSLQSGQTQSCGCLQKQRASEASKTHGETGNAKTKEYQAWRHALDRCQNPKNKFFKFYGGRGIECRFVTYESFLDAAGRAPSPQHSIDRYPDNDGHYEKGNIRWATKLEQSNNTRGNHIVEYRGAQYTLAELSRHAGMANFTMSQRLGKLGWCVECAVNVKKKDARRGRTRVCTHGVVSL